VRKYTKVLCASLEGNEGEELENKERASGENRGK